MFNNLENDLCECMHWRQEHLSKRTWIMGVLFGGKPGKCRAKDMHGIDLNCSCVGFDHHVTLYTKSKLP